MNTNGNVLVRRVSLSPTAGSPDDQRSVGYGEGILLLPLAAFSHTGTLIRKKKRIYCHARDSPIPGVRFDNVNSTIDGIRSLLTLGFTH